MLQWFVFALTVLLPPVLAYKGGGVGGGGEGNGDEFKKGPWTPAEDDILRDYIHKHGPGNWNAVQKNSGLIRSGKSCRFRWMNYLRPNLKKGSLTAEEEEKIHQLHELYGNKWARIAASVSTVLL